MKSWVWATVLVVGGVLIGSGLSYFDQRVSLTLDYRIWRNVEQMLMSEEERAEKEEFASRTNPEDTTKEYIVEGEPEVWESEYIPEGITVMPGVFKPNEAIMVVLPFMKHLGEDFFKGKDVMEIGTGSGVISLYSSRLGARSVVSTDINPAAIASITKNAEDLGYSDVIEPRLVPLTDMSAYSVIGDDETFDIIISNPPFALDLDAEKNDALTDRGDLGFTIVRGLEKHLRPGGKVVMLYGSNFYHNVMVKFARHEGYEVRHHNPVRTYPWAAETLYNSYLKRLLKAENMDPKAFYFDRKKDEGLKEMFLANYYLPASRIDYKPLLPGSRPWRYYEGMMVIERPDE